MRIDWFDEDAFAGPPNLEGFRTEPDGTRQRFMVFSRPSYPDDGEECLFAAYVDIVHDDVEETALLVEFLLMEEAQAVCEAWPSRDGYTLEILEWMEFGQDRSFEDWMETYPAN